MASPSSDASGIPSGQFRSQSPWGEFNNVAFVVQQALGKMQTATLVRIESCTNSGGVSPVGYVNVTPLINQLDGQGNPTPHVTIYSLPYLRLQGGANGIILDPEPGDIGVAVFASRDISQVKTTKKQGNPGSWRQYNFADGMYLGGMLNGTPTQYVQFSTTGIRIHSPTQVNIDAPDVLIEAQTVTIDASTSVTVTTPTFTVNGATVLNGTLSQAGGGAATFSGSMTVDGDVTAEGTSVHTHVHGGVQTGGGTTGAPV
jgi:phage baseplate assembly protein gpV